MFDITADKLKEKADSMNFQKYISDKELKIKKGGTLELNRKIVRTKSNKILLDPASTLKVFDTAVAQIAKDNNVAIAFSVSCFLKEKGINKVRLLKNMQESMQICLKMKNDIIICSNAENEWQLKDKELLIGFGTILGMTRNQAKWAMNQVYEDLI